MIGITLVYNEKVTPELFNNRCEHHEYWKTWEVGCVLCRIKRELKRARLETVKEVLEILDTTYPQHLPMPDAVKGIRRKLESLKEEKNG